jgi:predicted SnoaL-like aldol condensation-catalyzing enzyme
MDTRTERNKEIVVDFYDLLIYRKDFKKAAEEYLGRTYIQHNPVVEDGPEGLEKYIESLKVRYPDLHNEIKHIYAEGDIVIMHVHSRIDSNARGLSLIEIFRVDEGKIVEHWDVMQRIPEKSANNNTMF